MVAAEQPVAVRIGPTGIPSTRRSLGYAALEWATQYLQQPDGAKAGEPWEPTAEQARFVLWWYAIDSRGRLKYRRGTLRRMKGWGKDPLAAVIAAIEFVGPCQFAGFHDDGTPIVIQRPSAWVQVAAVSKDQTRTTMSLFRAMFSDEAIAEYDIDVGKEIVYAERGRAVIEAVTSSPRSLEGPRTTFTIKNETEHWLANNDGHEMSRVIARNAAKVGGRVLGLCNAHNPGEDSVGERDWEAWQKIATGKSRARGILYDCVEAPPDTLLAEDGSPCREPGCAGELRPLSGTRLSCNVCERGGTSLRAGLEAARGDAYWLDVLRLIEEIFDPETEPSVARRFYLNQIVAAEDAWVAPWQWDRLGDAKYQVAEKAQIALAFDGSLTDDHCALVGCEIATGHVFTLGIWDPADYGDEAPRELIDAAVDRAFARFDVVAFYSDLHPWESYVDAWSEEYGSGLLAKAAARHAIAWDMRGRIKDFTVAAETLNAAIVAGDFTHDANPMARQHVHNVRRRPNNFGVSMGKEHRESPRKIDFAVTTALARLARQDYLALPPSRQRKVRTGKASFFS